jgi:serine/threonine protein kinase
MLHKILQTSRNNIDAKKQDAASDIWSFGCLVYELIQHSLKPETKPLALKKRVLFTGSLCFKFSPHQKMDLDKTKIEIDYNDYK